MPTYAPKPKKADYDPEIDKSDTEEFVPPGKTKANIDRMPLQPQQNPDPTYKIRVGNPPLKYFG